MANRPASVLPSSSSPMNPAEAVLLMREGATMLKGGRQGKPHFRFFQLDEDLQTLKWSSPKKKSDKSSGTYQFSNQFSN
jgi:hypothetical protein